MDGVRDKKSFPEDHAEIPQQLKTKELHSKITLPLKRIRRLFKRTSD